MDKTIPAGAALILDFLGNHEAPQGYGTIYGNNQDRLTKPLVTMQLAEVIINQERWTAEFGSSACGRYQTLRSTLLDLKTDLRLSGLERFSPDFQDRLAYHLLKRRGYDAFMSGIINRTEFGLRLAKEWASMPVLDATPRSDGSIIARGRSYYSGDGRNRALVSPEAVEQALTAAQRLFGIPGSEMVATAAPGLPEAIESIKVEPDKPKTLASSIWRRLTGRT